MVKSLIAEQFRIELYQTDAVRWRFSPRDVLSDATITWGRQSLFDAPANRTLSFKVLLSKDLELNPASYLSTVVRAYRGTTLLFEGAIDQADLGVQTHRSISGGDHEVVVMSFHAVESKSFYGDLGQVSPTSGIHNVWELWNRFQGMNYRQVEVTPFFRNYSFVPFEVEEDYITLGEALSVVAAPFPLAQANWEPGHRKVHATIYRPDNPSTVLVSGLRTSIIRFDGPLSADFQNVPARVSLTTGGLYGTTGIEKYWRRTERNSIKRTRIGYIPQGYIGRKIEVNHPWPTDHWVDPGKQILDLIAMQRTSPVRVTVFDDLDPNRHRIESELYQTWEGDMRYQIIGPNPRHIVNAIGEGNHLAAIGGTLRVTPERTSHSLTMVYSYANQV